MKQVAVASLGCVDRMSSCDQTTKQDHEVAENPVPVQHEKFHRGYDGAGAPDRLASVAEQLPEQITSERSEAIVQLVGYVLARLSYRWLDIRFFARES